MEAEMDWMYKGNQIVNREEYLLGRPVDKAFEQMQQAEKETELNRVPKNHVEYECIPPSLRFFSGNEQVDLARKMQEDPLYTIKKKEIETKNQLLKNPVKLKQLRELLEQRSRKSKSDKKKKKSKHKDSSEDEAKLDILLATKYKQLKDNISETDLLKSMKKIKHKRKKKLKKRCHNSESESDNKDGSTSVKEKRRKRRKKRKHSTSDSDSDSSSSNSSNESDSQYEKRDNKKICNKEIDDSKKQVKKRKLSEDRNSEYERSKGHRKEHNGNHMRQRCEENDRQRDGWRNRYSDERRYPKKKRNDTTTSNNEKISGKSMFDTGHTKSKENIREEKYRSKTKPSLTEEEKERRRQEMMANAAWRDKEREKHVNLHREEEKKEAQNSKLYNKDFIRKQLVVATEVSTVASRIKANINNIQRSGRAMDTNFAKR